MLQQYSPDGDTSVFFYDRLGRLTASQNKEQKDNVSYSGPSGRFSYTLYDSLGRITLVGEKSTTTDVRTINMLKQDSVTYWLGLGTNKQITKTIYDNPLNLYQNIGASRKRVIASIYLENESDTEGDSILYSYDINGNVKTLIPHIRALAAVDTNGKKRVDYDYDLVSGKVNMVSYQSEKGDQFFYKYHYDADNRVTRSYSSRDKLIWDEDASYNYYLHGPLARTELGNYKVQGVDYAYTLQGWLKGINSDSLNANYDIGNDGKVGAMFSRVSRDVYGFKLGYFNNDHTPIDVTNATALATKSYTAPTSLANTGNQLFNGNISFTTIALSKINSGATAGYSYGYDQLNRLVEMRQHTTGTTSGWSNSNIITAYSESIAYDANGNILKYLRKGTAATPDMDSLNYNYNRDVNGNLVNNKLNHVRDNVNSSNYSVDIDNQSSNNYVYDKIGNLKKDVAEGIDTIRWTVYGKINKIIKNGGTTTIEYGYDPGGNRTSKRVNNNDTITTTFYVRDAQGNVLAVYSKKDAEPLKWNEQHLYGSSRLGIWNWDDTVPAKPPVVINAPIYDSARLGSKQYELTDHRGNVMAVISDKKIGNDSSGVVNYYIAEVLSQNDYFPFGMIQPGRRYSAGVGYRYSINGQEKENELNENITSAEFWMYDSRLGRRWNQDPKQSASNSSYGCFAGNPIFFKDPYGDTSRFYNSATGALIEEVIDGTENRNYEIGLQLYNKLKNGIKSQYSDFDSKINVDLQFSKTFVNILIYAAREPELWEAGDIPIVQELNEPPWVYYARSQIGINEDQNCSIIINRYHKANRQHKPKSCEDAWCASFIGHSLEQTGYDAQLDAGAAAYSNGQTRYRAGFNGVKTEYYGDPQWGASVGLDNPYVGAIGVLKSGSLYHVTFIIGQSVNGNILFGVGGNQGDAVTVSEYNKARFVAFMRPINYTVPEAAYNLPFRRSILYPAANSRANRSAGVQGNPNTR